MIKWKNVLKGSVKISCLLFLTGCVSNRQFDPYKKYAPEELKHDFTLFRNILKETHPSLYWYTSKETLDTYFDRGYASLKDSMTEPQFKTFLSYIISKINCGHTSLGYSKNFRHYIDTAKPAQFPLSIKLWEDSAVVYENLNKKDTLLRKGVVLKAIEDKPLSFYRDSIFQFISSDGYNTTYKYQALSNRGGFGAWYRNVFGLKDSFSIRFVDSLDKEHLAIVPLYYPKKKDTVSLEKKSRPAPVNYIRIDTSTKTAVFTIGTFSNGNHYKRLVRSAFRDLQKKKISNLILDVRNNGGGNVENSTLLTRYITDKPFRLVDSLYAVNKRNKYSKYIGHSFRNRLVMTLMSRKRKDGYYHFGYYERHTFQPKRHDHFNGAIYIITGGNSFSATTLFAAILKGQYNVTIIGEETGGGSYGNSAWLIPEVTLPHTGIRFRLPLFRMVMNRNNPKTGHGIFPDVPVRPTLTDIRESIDPKLAKAVELIRERR